MTREQLKTVKAAARVYMADGVTGGGVLGAVIHGQDDRLAVLRDYLTDAGFDCTRVEETGVNNYGLFPYRHHVFVVQKK